MQFSLLLIVASAVFTQCTPLAPRTVVTVTADITAIGNQATKLNNGLQNYVGGFPAALAINSDASQLAALINQGTNDIKAYGQASAAQTAAVLNQVTTSIQPTIVSALNQLVTKSDMFKQIGVAAIAKAANANLNIAASAFSSALVASADASSKAQALKIKADLDTAFAKATAAFSQN